VLCFIVYGDGDGVPLFRNCVVLGVVCVWHYRFGASRTDGACDCGYRSKISGDTVTVQCSAVL